MFYLTFLVKFVNIWHKIISIVVFGLVLLPISDNTKQTKSKIILKKVWKELISIDNIFGLNFLGRKRVFPLLSKNGCFLLSEEHCAKWAWESFARLRLLLIIFLFSAYHSNNWTEVLLIRRTIRTFYDCYYHTQKKCTIDPLVLVLILEIFRVTRS